MTEVLDNSLVGLVLLVSVLYAFTKLSPRNARQRMLGQFAEWLARAPSSLHLAWAAQRLARAADDKPGACGGCDTCGSEPRPQGGSAEIRVPIASIARARRPRPE
jgi:hypothetical protein